LIAHRFRGPVVGRNERHRVGPATVDAFHCIRTEQQDDVMIIQFLDEKIVNPDRVQLLGTELMSLVEDEGKDRILINLKNVRFLSSAAINKLVVLERRLKSRGGRLKFSDVRPEVQEVFNITQLNSLFDIRDKQADALRAFQRSAETS
jgi:anti-anti-sigma factor